MGFKRNLILCTLLILIIIFYVFYVAFWIDSHFFKKITKNKTKIVG
jgi:hypothetical protein